MAYHKETQKRYEQNLSEDDKKKRRMLKSFSACKSYVRLHATDKQLQELEELIKNRKEEIKMADGFLNKQEVIELLESGKHLYATQYEKIDEVAIGANTDVKNVTLLAQYDDETFTYEIDELREIDFVDGDLVYLINEDK